MYSIWYSTCYLLRYIGYISGVQWISSEYSAKIFYMMFPMLCYKIRIDYIDGIFLACNIVYDIFYTAFYRCILSGMLYFI